MSKWWIALAAAALLGCGAEGRPEAAEKLPAYALDVPLSEWQLTIDRRTLSSLQQTAIIQAGDVTFRVRNNGQEPHAFAIKGPDVDARTPTLAPGEEAELTVRLSASRYEVGCPEADHKERGLGGRIRGQ